MLLVVFLFLLLQAKASEARTQGMPTVSEAMATRNMLKGNIENLPPYKLLELRCHLEYIVEEEDSQPTPVFTATYSESASAGADGEFWFCGCQAAVVVSVVVIFVCV